MEGCNEVVVWKQRANSKYKHLVLTVKCSSSGRVCDSLPVFWEPSWLSNNHAIPFFLASIDTFWPETQLFRSAPAITSHPAPPSHLMLHPVRSYPINQTLSPPSSCPPNIKLTSFPLSNPKFLTLPPPPIAPAVTLNLPLNIAGPPLTPHRCTHTSAHPKPAQRPDLPLGFNSPITSHRDELVAWAPPFFTYTHVHTRTHQWKHINASDLSFSTLARLCVIWKWSFLIKPSQRACYTTNYLRI